MDIIIILILLLCCCFCLSGSAYYLFNINTPVPPVTSSPTQTNYERTNNPTTTERPTTTTERPTTTTARPTTTVATTTTTTTPAPSFITVYEHCNYEGRYLNLGIGVTSYEYLNGLNFNDIISSVKIPQGLRVILYEHGGLHGRQITLTSDTPCLINENFNDITSSINVQRI